MFFFIEYLRFMTNPISATYSDLVITLVTSLKVYERASRVDYCYHEMMMYILRLYKEGLVPCCRIHAGQFNQTQLIMLISMVEDIFTDAGRALGVRFRT